jgi:hypothetical protein
MMGAGGHVEVGTTPGASTRFRYVQKYRADESDVGQVSSAPKGIVEHHNVAIAHRTGFNCGCDRHGHGSKVNGHVVAHGDNLSFAIENCARIIAALLDIRRESSAAERRPHLLGDRVKDAFENFEFDRIACHEAQCNGLAGDVARQADAMTYPSGGPSHMLADFPGTRSQAKFLHCRENSIDTLLTVAQYLVL